MVKRRQKRRDNRCPECGLLRHHLKFYTINMNAISKANKPSALVGKYCQWNGVECIMKAWSRGYPRWAFTPEEQR